MKNAKLAKDLNQGISRETTEKILNGGQTFESDDKRIEIINSDGFILLQKLLRYHGDKPSEEEIHFANNWCTKEELKKKKTIQKAKRAAIYKNVV